MFTGNRRQCRLEQTEGGYELHSRAEQAEMVREGDLLKRGRSTK
jgi:hypothetical protein